MTDRVRLRLLAMVLIAAPVCAVAPQARLAAQVTGHGSLQLVVANLTEIDSTHSATGPGISGLGWAEWQRWHAEAVILYASLSPSAAGAASYGVTQWDLRVGYALTTNLALEGGLGGRAISPATKATGVTVGRVGVRPEMHFARQTAVWGRAAFLIGPSFNDGGEYGLAVELGLGAAVGLSGPDGKFRLRADYDFQRIDRRNGATALPIQLGVARVGVDAAW